MIIDLTFLEKTLIGCKVPLPLSGTTSGHAAGEPFDKHVFNLLAEKYPGKVYRQFEYLNKLYLDNPQETTAQGRFNLLKSSTLQLLLNRGQATTHSWKPNAQFVEKQNDTADIIIASKPLHLIDVKTYNSNLSGQSPNIISALKLAKMCKLTIENSAYDEVKISYIGLIWKTDQVDLACTSALVKDLFKVKPSSLYINWAAAMQVQFHVHEIDQDYAGGVEEWCREYLKLFSDKAEARAAKMIRDYVLPYRVTKK